MPYIGNDIQFGELTSQTFTGDGSTTAFTLSYTVANPTSLIVTIANVIQEPTTAYTVAGTTLTCTSAPADGDTIHVRFLGRVVDVANAAILQDSDQDTKIQVEESADEDTIRFDIAGAEVATLTNSALTLKGTTPTLTIGDAGAEDTKIVFDGNAQDYYIGLDDGTDDLLIGLGNAVGTTPAISIDENLAITTAGDITMGGTTPTLTIGDGGAEDTKIVFDGNAQDYYIGIDDAGGSVGADVLTIGNGSTVGSSPAISINSDEEVTIHAGLAGRLLMGDHDGTHNANNTRGLTVELGDADNEAVSLKSSDVAHGLTGQTETDTFLAICKGIAATGGGGIKFYHENAIASNPSYMMFFGGTAATGKTTSEYGLFWQDVHEHDGSNGIDNITANGNCYSWHAQSGGTANRTLMILDEDGDLHVDGSSSLSAFDAWDDAALLRSLELWREGETEGKLSDQMLKSRYDANKYTKEQLELTKLIQVVPDKDWAPTGPDAQQALVNTGALGRITTGAVWQNHEMLDAIIETMEERDAGFTAALKKKFVARGLPTQILDWDGDIPDDLKKPDVAPKAFNAD